MIVLSGLKHKECPTGDALLEMKYLGTIIFLKDTAARDQCKNAKQNSIIKQKCIIENS